MELQERRVSHGSSVVKSIHSDFPAALRALGIRCSSSEVPPLQRGHFCRLHVEGDRSGKNLAVCMTSNGLGYIKDWKRGGDALFRLGDHDDWGSSAVSTSLSDATPAAVDIVRRLLAEAPIVDHANYFSAKGIDITGLRLRSVTPRELADQYGYGCLGRSDTPYVVIPAFRISEDRPVLCTAQLIGGSPAKKHFLKGGKKKGGFWSVCRIPKAVDAPVIGVAEGVATAISAWRIFKEPGALTTVVAAFDCGNLSPVCISLRRRWPRAQIIVFADNDRPETDRTPNENHSPENVGVCHAIDACRKVGGRCHAPSFSKDDCQNFRALTGHLPSDWNDYMKLHETTRSVK